VVVKGMARGWFDELILMLFECDLIG